MPSMAIISLLVAGVSAVITQILLIRELTAVFYGNELFVGWLLFCWLFWSGVWSLVFGRWSPQSLKLQRAAGFAHSVLALILPLLTVAARCGRTWIGLPIALPDLPRAMLFAFALLAPPTACLSAIFLINAKRVSALAQSISLNRSLGLAYMWETLGFVAGGVLFGYTLILADSFYVAALLQWLNVVAAGAWYAPRGARSWLNKAALVTAAAAATFVAASASRLGRFTLQCVFPHQQVLAHAFSRFGLQTVTALGAQRNYYHGGTLVGSDEDAEWNEQVVHLAMLGHPNPQRVLLIGGGLTGALNEILKHNPERVDYVELDPTLIRLARCFLPPRVSTSFDDPRVRLIHEDGRGFLNRAATDKNHPRYDVILINTADPTSLLLNRYYTVECWRHVRALLATGGLMSTHMSFSPDSPSPRQARAAATAYAGLSSVFPSVRVLSEYAIFFIASAETSFPYDPPTLADRMASRGIETAFVSPAFLEYRLTTDRNRQALQQLKLAHATANRDAQPRAMFYAVTHWLYALHPRMAAALDRLESFGRRPIWFALVALGLTAIYRTRYGTNGGSMVSMAMISFSLMACETSLLLLFQIVYGYLYYRIAVIVAAVMLGLAAGSWAGVRWNARSFRALFAVHAGFVSASLALIGMVLLQATWAWRAAALYQLGLLLLACGIGILSGLEFVVANALLLAGNSDHRRAGWIYAADLFGACAGALITPLWIIPLFGLTSALGLVALANIIMVGALTLSRSPQKKPCGQPA